LDGAFASIDHLKFTGKGGLSLPLGVLALNI